MENKKKICPIMSGPGAAGTTGKRKEYIECLESDCALWVQVYSTENILQPGACAFAIQPVMVDGLLRV